MSNLLDRRRGLMGQGGDDAPVFVDWILLSPFAYITTDIPLGTDITFDCILGWDKQPVTFFGEQHSSAAFVLYNTSNQIHCFAVGSARKHYGGIETNAVHRYRYNTDGRYIVDNVNLWSYSRGTYQFGHNLVIGAIYNSGEFQPNSNYMKVKNASFVKNEYSWSFLPCYYRGEYGLWNTVDNTFHGNASGQGTITGGYDE